MIQADIKNFTLEEIENILIKTGEKPYRAKQIFHWLYQKGSLSFKEMSDISEKTRNELEQNFHISFPLIHSVFTSIDGTKKFVFKLQDNNFIETVLIPSHDRNTICISTQVGCKYGCKFCASGKRFIRDLTSAEMINQVIYPLFSLKTQINNIVVMGMGEPFDNFNNLIKFIKILNSKYGINIGARKIVVSTCGIIPGIKQFSKIGLQVRLSISFHATNNKIRNLLMPVNKKYPLEALIKTCQDYIQNTGRQITIEYILIKNINDTIDDAIKLSHIAKQLKASINLIPYQHIQGKEMYAPTKESIKKFTDIILNNHVRFTIRNSKGSEIQAACGQLAGKL
jgi:23S rRNA (adenine2503-C2)-methyltransferase